MRFSFQDPLHPRLDMQVRDARDDWQTSFGTRFDWHVRGYNN
jgi:hypothetical protein